MNMNHSRKPLVWLTVLSLLVRMPSGAFAERALPEDYVKYPVLVTLESGRTASGFYMNGEKGEAYFVTAKHLLFENDASGQPALKGQKALLMSYPKEENLKEPILLQLDLQDLYSYGYLRAHKEKDAVVVKIGSINEVNGTKALAFYPGVHLAAKVGEPVPDGSLVGAHGGVTRNYRDVAVGNAAFIFGYPVSLGIESYPQIDYKKPLLRKGVIAGKNDEKMSIILDCPVNYGNSGGPVVEVEKVGLTETHYYIIGMVSEFIPFDDKWYGIQNPGAVKQIENSGYSVVVPIDTILELIKQVDENIPSRNDTE